MTTLFGLAFSSIISILLLLSSLASTTIGAFGHKGRLFLWFVTLLVMIPANPAFAATPIAGSGTALEFDGTNDQVIITGYKGITGTNPRTIEAWIKTTGSGAIVSWGKNKTSQKWVFQVDGSTGVLKVGINGGSLTGSFPVNDGQWHHVACTFKDDDSPNVTDVKLYVDGQPDDTPSASKSKMVDTASGKDVKIGNDHNGNFFKGQIDEVRIWNVARTEIQIQENMYTPLQSGELGLVAFYDFEDGAGTTATDLAGSHNGTLTNMDETTAWVDGIIGFTTNKNTPLNDTLDGYDADGDPLTYHIVNPASKGNVEITNENTGAFTYIPNANATGTDSFTYKVNDLGTDSNIATVTVNITNINNAPIAGSGTSGDDTIIGNFTFTTNKNKPLSDTLDGYDADSDPLTYHIVNPASKGTVEITNENTGTFTYTPATNATGTDSFTYKVNDLGSDSNIATVTVNINNLNQAPIAGFGTALDFNGNLSYIVIPNYKGITGRDPRTVEAWIKTTLTNVTIVSWGQNDWVLKLDDTGSLILLSNFNTIGKFPINDGQWHHVACTFEFNSFHFIDSVKLYIDGRLEVEKKSGGQIYTTSQNDVQIGNFDNLHFKSQIDEVRIWSVARTGTQIKANMYQTLSGNEAGLEVYYTFNQDPSLSITDQTANHRNGVLTNTHHNENWVNLPILFNTNLNMAFSNVLIGDDADGDPLTYSIDSGPSKGTLTLDNSATGAFTYTPNDWQRDVDTFTYKINDGGDDSNIETVTINITPPTYSTGTYGNAEVKEKKLSIPRAESLIVFISGESELNMDWLEILQSDNTSFNPPKRFSGVINEVFAVNGEMINISFTSNDSITTSGVTVTIDNRPWGFPIDKMCDTNNPLHFSVTDFTDHFIDPTGNSLDTVKIISKPNKGELTLNGSVILAGQIIPLNQLYQLTYTPASDYSGRESFLWEGSNGQTFGTTANQAPVNIVVQGLVELNGETMDLATAIQQANSNDQDNTITFLKDIKLFEPLPAITGTVQFKGNDFSINGDEKYQVFFVDGGTVHFSDLTIQNGLVRGGDGGDGANHSLSSWLVSGGGGGGGAGMGGAIFSNTGSLIVENVTFVNNQALGGNGGNGGQTFPILTNDGQPGQAGFKQIRQLVFGSGGGGGGLYYKDSKAGLGGNDLNLGDGGDGSASSNGSNGNSGYNSQMLGNGGGGGGSSYRHYGGAGGDSGFGGSGGGGGHCSLDDGFTSQAGKIKQFGGRGGNGTLNQGGGGGGGAGLGGAIFVRAGSSLTLIDSTFTNNIATGGNGGNGTSADYNGANGEGHGGAIFIQTGATAISNGGLIFSNNSTSTANPDVKGLLKPIISVAAGSTPVKETGTQAGTFIISSTGIPIANEINFTVVGTATLGTDYTITGAETIDGNNGTAIIPALPNKSVTLTITPIDDSDADPDETIQLILNQGTTYELAAAETSTASLTIKDNDSLAFTDLYLETNAATILNDDKLNIVGKLNIFTELKDNNLAGLPIVLTITTPDGIQETLRQDTLTDTGQFRFDNVWLENLFSTSMQDGAFGFQARFAGTDDLAPSNSPVKMVLVGASAGYAILIQGKIQNEEGLAAHHKTIDRIYKKFIARGFDASNIKYFNYDTTQEGVDGLPLKSDIAAAFTELQGRVNSNPAPFYVVMIDHGSIDGTFHIYNDNANDVITPTDLDGWLDNFEAGLKANALNKARLVMLGACYSGSFIPVISQTGRTIITSAAATEESYKGPAEEPDGIRSGEFFMEEFFARLERSDNIKAAFEFATEKTETFTRRGDGNTLNRFYDDANQHPLLDDNGDGQGSNLLTADANSDGFVTQKLFLGIGLNYDTNSADNPAEIISVSKTIYLDANTSVANLEAKVNDGGSVNVAPVDIRKPSVILKSSGTETSEQLEITNLPREFLLCNAKTHSCLLQNFNVFHEPGMYEAFYFVRDKETLDISPVKRSVIYKNYPNNPAPSAFDLLEPLDGSEHRTNLLFKWEPSIDDDGPVTYNFIIMKVLEDPETEEVVYEVVYEQEELKTAMTYADKAVGLEDKTTYVWKVEAVDPFGERTTSSSMFLFKTDNTNAPPGIGSLHLSSALDFTPIENNVKFSFFKLNPDGSLMRDKFGNPISVDQTPQIHRIRNLYNMLLPQMRRRALIQVDGYQDQEIDLDATQGTVRLNVEMVPIGGIPTQPGKLQFTEKSISLAENIGTATVLVERVNGNDTEIAVDYTMTDGSATASSDYTNLSGTLIWPAKDERAKAINLPITDDQDYEGEETFVITLSSPTGGTAEYPAQLGEPNQILITIDDDEAAPEPVPGTLQFSTNTYSATEGDSSLNLNVTRTGGSDGDVSVQYMVSGTAALNTDYTGGTGLLTWGDGDSVTKLLTFHLIDDDEVEETETLTLRLFEPTGNATLGTPAQATLSIADNDEAGIAGTVQFAVANYAAQEGDHIIISVTRTGGDDGEIEVQYLVTGESTAVAGSDYNNTSGTLTWANGDSSAKLFTVNINDDQEVEPTETITLMLSNPTGGASLGHPAQTTLNITDDDVAIPEDPELMTTSEPTTPKPVTTSEPIPTPKPAIPSEPVEPPKTVTTPPVPVTTSEPVTISPPGTSGISEAGRLQFALTTYLANEGDGEFQAITVTRTGNSKGKVSVQYSATADSSAELEVDYTGGFGTLTWADGDIQPKVLPLTILADDEVENQETVNLMLFEPTGNASLGYLARTTLIIVDNALASVNFTTTSVVNPNAGTLQFSKQFYSVSEDIGLTNLEVIRTGGSEGKVSVQYTTLDNGTALFNYDYVGGTDKLTWEDGDTSAKPITIMLFDDQLLENLETIPLILSEPTGGASLGAPGRATLVVVDNDEQPEISTPSLAEIELASSPEELTSSSSLNVGKSASSPEETEFVHISALPNLGRGIVVTRDGSTLSANTLEEMVGITVAFRGGASANNQAYQASLTTTPSQIVKITGEIEIADAHLGLKADLLTVVGVFDEISDAISLLLMFDNQERLQVWNGEFATLIGHQENIVLSKTQTVEIYHGFIEPIRVQIYFGYRLQENGAIYFNGEQPIELQVTENHADNGRQEPQVVWHTEFSPDGEQIVMASSKGHVSLWDANNGNRLAKLVGHTQKVKSAVFSDDGQWLVTSSHDSTARLWDVVTQKEVMVFSGHQRALEYATFSPNAQHILTASADKTARLWDTNNGETLFILKGHEQGIPYATFSHDGKQIVTASWDQTARLWDAETGEEIAVLTGHENMLEHAIFSPNDQRIVTSSWDKTARLWDIHSGQAILSFIGHQNGVAYAAFSPNGEYLVTTSWDNSVRLWEAESGEMLWERKHQASIHHADFSPDGQLIVTGSNDGTACLWETATGKLFKTLQGHEGNVWQVRFSPDGKRVLSASWDNTVRVWKIDTGEVVMVLTN